MEEDLGDVAAGRFLLQRMRAPSPVILLNRNSSVAPTTHDSLLSLKIPTETWQFGHEDLCLESVSGVWCNQHLCFGVCLPSPSSAHCIVGGLSVCTGVGLIACTRITAPLDGSNIL